MYGVILHSLSALLTAFALAAVLAPVSIPMLRSLKEPKAEKAGGLPTMGGMILFGAALLIYILGTLLAVRLSVRRYGRVDVQ